MSHVSSGFPVTLACLCLLTVGLGGCRQSGGQPPDAAAAAEEVAPDKISTAVRFVDVAQQDGLDYRWSIPGKRPLDVLQTIGDGCAFLDYNNDGNLDILLVGSHPALYKGDGHGHFTDVTHQTGLDTLRGHFLGCAVGDYDNDGYDDIYLSAYRGGALLHNRHGNSFQDVSAQAGIAPQPWGTSCGFADIDGSGRLSLYIGNYADFGPNTPRFCQAAGVQAACGPQSYKPLKGTLYRNLGAGRFRDITASWGALKTSGRVLGVAFADFDGSGHQGLYVSEDEIAGNLLKNSGARFHDIGVPSGTAFDYYGATHGGMGTDWGDYDNDGWPDLAVMTFQHEAKCIYHNSHGSDLFTEQSQQLGLFRMNDPHVAFGVKWLDADNDGWLDLMITNGHVQDNIAVPDKSTTYRQETQFFYNQRGRHFGDNSSALVGPAGRQIVGRGLAVGDFDNDGRIDALAVDSEGRPLLLHNETVGAGHWIEIDLIGARSNRDGLGAVITVVASDGRKQVRLCTTGGSYLSASAKRVHIGLGAAAAVKALSVRWSSGQVDDYRAATVDRVVTLHENGGA